ncbi:MAG TPA: glycoside hydrolase family 15 protein, partial [Actinomycetota bacterium]|nr:glycoside hydrolase family 15 protein [Actinomycetota bacterium]
RLHPARQDPGAGRLAADDAAGRVRRPHRSDVAVDPGRDGSGAGLRQPGVPLRPAASPDGLRGHEGTFSICTFWYVDALARSGRMEQARLAFEKMFTYANHLGLYAEEIGQTGEQLGNFPQAFTHLSLINAAVNLDHQLDHGPGRDPVWSAHAV